MPKEIISNEELASSFNKYAEKFNKENYERIKSGEVEAVERSDPDFIFKASGIRKRHVINKDGILNIDVMRPVVKGRDDDDMSLQCEMAVKAARRALKKAHKKASEIDAVIVACSNMQRPYPAIAIEVQKALNICGWGYDMNAACSSAVFGINAAVGSIKNNLAKSILVIVPEMYTGHLNFRDRKSHFIFGDATAAVVVELWQYCNNARAYKIIEGRLQTLFSNNIRNNSGFLNYCESKNKINLFTQNGKAVREEVVPLAASHIIGHLNDLNICPSNLKRLWLHQSNSNMNANIAK